MIVPAEDVADADVGSWDNRIPSRQFVEVLVAFDKPQCRQDRVTM